MIVIDSPAAGQNRISGTSGGEAFEAVTFFDINSVILNLGANDSVDYNQDSVTISDSIVASGLQSLSILTGEGDDSLVLDGVDTTVNADFVFDDNTTVF